jgi:pSer/pThr/pTyr-binding forkhead associated (FHA) protein
LRGEISLGRDKSNGVVVADQKVSRHHATLTPIEDTFILSDQGSANGTYLNGVLISQPTRLNPRDRISIGDTAFLFTNNLADADHLNQKPVGAASLKMPTQTVIQNPLLTSLGLDNTPLWILIGCMGLIIIGLLLALAVLLGLIMGRGQLAAGLIFLAMPGWL